MNEERIFRWALVSGAVLLIAGSVLMAGLMLQLDGTIAILVPTCGSLLGVGVLASELRRWPR